MRPCFVALGWTLIRNVSPDELRSFANWVSSIPNDTGLVLACFIFEIFYFSVFLSLLCFLVESKKKKKKIFSVCSRPQERPDSFTSFISRTNFQELITKLGESDNKKIIFHLNNYTKKLVLKGPIQVKMNFCLETFFIHSFGLFCLHHHSSSFHPLKCTVLLFENNCSVMEQHL